MARQIELDFLDGVSGATCDLYLSDGSDSVAAESGIALTEGTNKKRHYLGTVTVAAGDYDVIIKDSGGTILSHRRRYIGGTDGLTYYKTPEERKSDLMMQDVRYALTVLCGTIANAGNATETFDLTVDGTDYRVSVSGLDASGNRTGQTLSQP